MLPPAVPPLRRRRRWPRWLLLGASLLLAALLGEGALRLHGGYRLFALPLQRAPAAANGDLLLQFAADLVGPFVERQRQSHPDLDPAWLEASPPALVRPPVPERLARRAEQHQEWLLLYDINEALLRSLWVPGQGIAILPGLALPDDFSVFAPPAGRKEPRYRYPPSCTLPTGMTTNAFGFRGRELGVDKPARVVRIAFVGASTTVEAPRLPFSAPELLEHWLGLWARQQGLDVRFETLNAAREAILSPDIRAIVEDELLPLAVDYVVYYEGANQLQPSTIQRHVQVEGSYRLADPPPGLVGTFDGAGGGSEDTTWLDRLAGTLAAAQYLRTALQGKKQLAEPAKPAQRVALPDGCASGPFPLARAGEVLELGAIERDLDAIRAVLAGERAQLLICTFCWLAEPGMTVDRVLGANIHVHLNRAYWPFEYATVRALADVQNRFFSAWAKDRGVDLIDLDALLPRDPRLYIDAIHHNELGVRLKAWALFAALTKVLARDLGKGRVPVPDPRRDGVHPNFAPARVLTRADLDAGR